MSNGGSRNKNVEKAVDDALHAIDGFISGDQVPIPAPSHRRAIDNMIKEKRGSIRLATLFLLFYWRLDEEWNKRDIPVGIRGKYGDKRFSEELKKRNITLHDNITAFGENLGWKRNLST